MGDISVSDGGYGYRYRYRSPILHDIVLVILEKRERNRDRERQRKTDRQTGRQAGLERERKRKSEKEMMCFYFTLLDTCHASNSLYLTYQSFRHINS